MEVQLMKEIKMIPKVILYNESNKPNKKRRVAAYARVSTDKEEQQTSYEAQIDYYTKLIDSNPGYEMVKVYTDEGISATSTKHRKGFNEMISEALKGNIDLIITKSVSRFARNTVDSLTAIRTLKEAGCEVFFEKENIYTFDSKGELLITIMSSLAQEESRSLSENITWSVRKGFSDGKYTIHFTEFLGYKKGENGEIEIDQKEAIIVRRIYLMFLEGMGFYEICKELNKEKIPTPMGKKTWYYSVVRSILQNEKYIGDAILQKTFSVSFLTKKRKKNEGEVPKYYVTNGHPAIISRELFLKVKRKIEKYKRSRFTEVDRKYSKRIMCSTCHKWYCESIYNAHKKSEKVVWKCVRKNRNINCSRISFTILELKEIFKRGVNQVLGDRLVLERVVKSFEIKKKVIDYLLEEIKEIKKYLEYDPMSLSKRRIRALERMISEAKKINELIEEMGNLDYNNLVKRIKEAGLKDKLIDYIRVVSKEEIYIVYNNGEEYLLV